MPNLKIATYNIHKGFSQFNRRLVIHELRERLRMLDADIVFLQEAQGEHSRHAERYHNYPENSHHEFLAEEVWPHHAYGKNSVYEAGHHGNAILSRFPILQSNNLDVSAHRFESRGLLHCAIEKPGRPVVHCLCVHFGLFGKGRRDQANMLIEYIQREVPGNAPLIIAGDFNDWMNRISHMLSATLHVQDVFHQHLGTPARSFPAAFPVLRLDRIYVRGFSVQQSLVHAGREWQHLSDHAALSSRLRWLGKDELP